MFVLVCARVSSSCSPRSVYTYSVDDVARTMGLGACPTSVSAHVGLYVPRHAAIADAARLLELDAGHYPIASDDFSFQAQSSLLQHSPDREKYYATVGILVNSLRAQLPHWVPRSAWISSHRATHSGNDILCSLSRLVTDTQPSLHFSFGISPPNQRFGFPVSCPVGHVFPGA